MPLPLSEALPKASAAVKDLVDAAFAQEDVNDDVRKAVVNVTQEFATLAALLTHQKLPTNLPPLPTVDEANAQKPKS